MRAELAALIEAADNLLAKLRTEDEEGLFDHAEPVEKLRDALAAARKALEEPDQLAAALAHDATSIGIADNLLQQLSEAKSDVAKVIRARNFYEQLWKEAEGKLERDEAQIMSHALEENLIACKERLAMIDAAAKTGTVDSFMALTDKQKREWFATNIEADSAKTKLLRETEQSVHELNETLRAAGWGQGEIDSAYETIAKLEERLAECEKDSGRLDWLERVIFHKTWSGSIGDPHTWSMAGPYRHVMQYMKGSTLRVAIDAAIAKEKP